MTGRKTNENIINNSISGVNDSKPTEIKENDDGLKYYSRTKKELEAMPEVDTTMTICPECKLIIKGTLSSMQKTL